MGTATPRDFDTVGDVYLISDKGDSGIEHRTFFWSPVRMLYHWATRDFWELGALNRPLASSKNPHFQNEAKCTTFLVKMSFIRMRMKIIFISKAENLTSFWCTDPGKLGNGVLSSCDQDSAYCQVDRWYIRSDKNVTVIFWFMYAVSQLDMPNLFTVKTSAVQTLLSDQPSTGKVWL